MQNLDLNISELGKQDYYNDFVKDYLEYINKDILKVMNYYGKNAKLKGCFLRSLFDPLYLDLSRYLSNITNITNATQVSRLGDLHNNKCTVLVENPRKKVIYKPIPSHFLNLINDIFLLLNCSDFNFYILKILFEDENGSIIEYINNEDIIDIDNFSYHYGALILLLTLLRGTDFHVDNIFNVSSTPVVIDYETLFYPHIPEYKAYDVTATSLIKTERNSHSLMNFYKFNIEKIIKGVRSAGRVINKNKKTIVALIETYKNKLTRVIFKPTIYYFTLLKNSTHPLLLIDPDERRKYLENSLSSKMKISCLIRKYEIQDLMEFNIPSFYFKDGNLMTSKETLIHQDIIFSATNKIFEQLDGLHYLEKAIIQVVRRM